MSILGYLVAKCKDPSLGVARMKMAGIVAARAEEPPRPAQCGTI